MAKLSNTVFGRNKVVVMFIMKWVGGKVYTALSVYNEIHGTIGIYSSPKLRNERPCLNFALHITYIRAYMPSRRLRRLDTPLHTLCSLQLPQSRTQLASVDLLSTCTHKCNLIHMMRYGRYYYTGWSCVFVMPQWILGTAHVCGQHTHIIVVLLCEALGD